MKNVEKVKLALLGMQRHSWEQGVAMQAFYESKEYDLALRLAIEAAYRKHDDGRVAAIGDMAAQTDPSACGEVLVWAAEKTGLKMLKDAAAALLEYNLKTALKNEDGIIYHMNYDKSFWVDSMYMLPPFLAVAGKFDEAVKQMKGYYSALFIKEKGMLGHRYDDESKSFTRDCLWSTGNGWALAGLVRLIDLLPSAYDADKNDFIDKARNLIEGFLRYLPEGFILHDELDNPDSFPDGAGTLLLSYSIYRAMISGWLPTGFEGMADALLTAVDEKVDEYGFVREVAGAPHFMTPGISPEAQAFYLLACSAKTKFDKWRMQR